MCGFVTGGVWEGGGCWGWVCGCLGVVLVLVFGVGGVVVVGPRGGFFCLLVVVCFFFFLALLGFTFGLEFVMVASDGL